MSALPPLPLLICSIGNPGAQYAHTLHSAGHTVVGRLAAHFGHAHFARDRSMGNGLVSRPPSTATGGDWTLWQSTSYMNESGAGVSAAYQTWAQARAPGHGRLVVVHDELERPLGALSLRTAPGLSARGHNGLKSVLAALGGTRLARIGVGIGRPASRARGEVARHVLRPMDAREKERVEASVAEVVTMLRRLELRHEQ